MKPPKIKHHAAEYIKNKHPLFKGNPFIEALPCRLKVEPFWESVVKEIELPDSVNEFDDETKEQFAHDLMDSVEPTSLYYEVYCDVLGILKSGYKDRNPKNDSTRVWQHQVSTDNHERIRSTANSVIFTGYSGMGKTTLLDAILSLIPPVILHPADGPLGYEYCQIVYIKVSIPGDADLKQICLSIIGKIDSVMGTQIKDEYEEKKRNTKQCIARLVTLCTTHLIGMIIFDEIQNICLATPNAQKLVFTLFDSLSNDAKVPTVKIGTTKAHRLINTEFTNARRLGIPVEWTNYQAHDEDWLLLLEYAWECQLLPKKVDLTDEFRKIVYRYTQGVSYCLFFLIEQSNIMGLRRNCLCFTSELFEDVYRNKFRIMRPAISALRTGNTEAFDDLYQLNNVIDKDVKALIKKLLKISHDEKLKGEAAKSLLEEIEKLLPEYTLTSSEAITVKRLQKESALVPTNMETDDGGWSVPI